MAALTGGQLGEALPRGRWRVAAITACSGSPALMPRVTRVERRQSTPGVVGWECFAHSILAVAAPLSTRHVVPP